jgi:hypothetical protein
LFFFFNEVEDDFVAFHIGIRILGFAGFFKTYFGSPKIRREMMFA